MWLALAGILPLLAVGSGATAGTSQPPSQNGLIAVSAATVPDGIQIVDPGTGKVTSVPNTDTMDEPAWSPDGTLLAVTELDSVYTSVYTMKPDGSDRLLLTDDGMSPTWSPDGKWVAVVREIESDNEKGTSELAIIRADATEERVLALDGYGAVSVPAWSPGGKLIAFVDYAGRIQLITPEGEKQRTLDVHGDMTSVSWSPDSSRLAFDRSPEANRTVIVVLDLETGKETVLPGDQDGAASPVWSPDGKQLAFLSLSREVDAARMHWRSQLWVMDTDGANARPLLEDGFYMAASWARAVEHAAADDTASEPPTREPAVTPPIAREHSPSIAEPETPATPKAKAPPVAPQPLPAALNGLIAVRGLNAIYLVDPDSAAAHKVPGTAAMIAPSWSPDGSLLAVERVEEAGGSSIYTIRPDGTHPQLVLKNASAPSWSAAGDRIFVARNECSTPCEPEDDKASVLYGVRPDGSDLQPVDAEQADVQDRELAWRTDGSPIWFFEDGRADAPGSFDTAAAAWSPDETRIAFIGALGPTDDDASADTVTAGLWIVSADGGAPQLLLKGASGRPSWPSAGR